MRNESFIRMERGGARKSKLENLQSLFPPRPGACKCMQIRSYANCGQIPHWSRDNE